jgi:hypothetical protein
MAKGASSKEIVKNKLLEVFEGAFIASDGKTIRIPLIEDGEALEIKVALTAAKDLEGSGAVVAGDEGAAPASPVIKEVPSQEEIDNAKKMLERINSF